MMLSFSDIDVVFLPTVFMEHPVGGFMCFFILLYLPPLVLASVLCKSNDDLAYIKRKLGWSILCTFSLIGLPLAVMHMLHVYKALASLKNS